MKYIIIILLFCKGVFSQTASILPEISIDRTISIPSLVLSCQFVVDCGLAIAKIKNTDPMILKMYGRCFNLVFKVFLLLIELVSENRILLYLFLWKNKYHKNIIAGNINR